jgi:hypothetical protein
LSLDDRLGEFFRIWRNNFPERSGGAFGAGFGSDGSAGASTVALVGGGTSPTSAGTGGGRSPPSSAGKEAIPAMAAMTIAAARPAVAHLIWRPFTSR